MTSDATVPGEVYRIIDEPRPSALAGYAVSPSSPLLAMMLGGSWIGLPWFLFNGLAMRSPNLRREIATMIGTSAVALAIAAGAQMILGTTNSMWPYVYLAICTAKLAGGYWLTQLQAQPYALHAQVIGRTRSAFMIALASSFARVAVLKAAFAFSPWLGIVVL
jgi:hypothetical protein